MTIEKLREICMALPQATEDIKYGTDLCFSIASKIFCGTRVEGPFRTGIKCTQEDYAELVEREGIVPMPRLYTTCWIRIENPAALSATEWNRCIKKSYELIVTALPNKIKQSLKNK